MRIALCCANAGAGCYRQRCASDCPCIQVVGVFALVAIMDVSINKCGPLNTTKTN